MAPAEHTVSKQVDPPRSRWCIVVADDHGPDWAVGLEGDPAPVQYCRLREAATPLQRSLHRAAVIAPTSQVIVTAFEEYRGLWESSAWFVSPERRFVSDGRAASQLSSAAAILSIAACSPSNVITILPARCFVAQESILRRALDHALLELPGIPEGVVTLGMLDLEEGVDEDYLVVRRPRVGIIAGGRGRDCSGRRMRITVLVEPWCSARRPAFPALAPARLSTTRIRRVSQRLERAQIATIGGADGRISFPPGRIGDGRRDAEARRQIANGRDG